LPAASARHHSRTDCFFPIWRRSDVGPFVPAGLVTILSIVETYCVMTNLSLVRTKASMSADVSGSIRVRKTRLVSPDPLLSTWL
jgi:hypothetical protein